MTQLKSPIRLGLFELVTRLSAGGMGEVWRGIHIVQKVPVAVKVITRAKARQLKYLASIRNEVRAVARLNHPGIVMVFDHGEVTREAEVASEGALVAGSPYLVMEYASRGSLDQLPLPLGWRELKVILLSVLDALAHAHARGVIHRDLKPANVLFAGRRDLRPGPKLTDFGLAHALEAGYQDLLVESVIGTPTYMAPEQLCGLWRDFGPWTDLYALGCMAYQLATGRLPFTNEDYYQLALDHMFTPPPPMQQLGRFPRGFEGWVMRLLQKVPRQRFQRAADAATALILLGDGSPADRPPVGAPPPQTAEAPCLAEVKTNQGPTTPTLPILDEFKAFGTTLSLKLPPLTLNPELALTRGAPDMEGMELCPVPAIYIPESWERPTLPDPPLQLIGVGLGLFGLRMIPLVDRRHELDILWRSLRQVHEQGRPQLAFLRGPSGCGKTRVVEWIGERAHEVGAATNLRAVHELSGGPGSGIPRMMANYLGCMGLSRHEVLARTKWFVRELGIADDYEWNALTELMMPATDEDLVGGSLAIRFGRPAERYELIRRILERLTLERPVIVWLEDVQWGGDSIAFAHHLLVRPPSRPLPVLFVLTARDEALAMRPVESRQLKDLLSLANTCHVPVGPLEPADHSALVRSLLHLEGDLAELVEKRTQGNPQFAIHLVGDWVRRGVLELGPNGFLLKAGEEAVLPDDIHMIWTARTEQILDEVGAAIAAGDEAPVERDHLRTALELMAVLGQDVDMGEWQDLCRQASLPYPRRLPDVLVSHRLASPLESGWLSVQGMLRESLERSAREAGRWPGHNRLCAAMLKRRFRSDHPGFSERLGLHLAEAGEYEEALEALLRGVTERWRASDFHPVLSLLDQYDAILARLDGGGSDRRGALGHWWRARLLLRQADFDGALRWAESAARSARQCGANDILTESLSVAAVVARWRGKLTDSLSLLKQALILSRSTGNDPITVHCLRHLGVTELELGDLSAAGSHFQEAQSINGETGDLNDWASNLLGMARVAQERRQVESSLRLVKQALEFYNQEGNRHGVATCLNTIGENLRLQGHLDAAEVNYQKSVDLFLALGTSVEPVIPRLNLAVVDIERKQYRNATRTLQEAVRFCVEHSLAGILAHVHCLLLVLAAGEGDLKAWDYHFGKATDLIMQTGRVQGDMAWAVQLAGDLVGDAGDRNRAGLAFWLARRLWVTLDRTERVQELDVILQKYS